MLEALEVFTGEEEAHGAAQLKVIKGTIVYGEVEF